MTKEQIIQQVQEQGFITDAHHLEVYMQYVGLIAKDSLYEKMARDRDKQIKIGNQYRLIAGTRLYNLTVLGYSIRSHEWICIDRAGYVNQLGTPQLLEDDFEACLKKAIAKIEAQLASLKAL